MENITIENVVAEVRKLASEQPDFNYMSQSPDQSDTGCSYLGAVIGVEGGQGCIVGQALTRLGVPAVVLREHEGSGARHVIAALRETAGAYMTEAEHVLAYWLGNVQAHQDRGDPWAEAVALADE